MARQFYCDCLKWNKLIITSCLAALLNNFVPANFGKLIICSSFLYNKNVSSTHIPTFQETVYTGNMIKPGDYILSSNAQM